jgi:transposase-like protein
LPLSTALGGRGYRQRQSRSFVGGAKLAHASRLAKNEALALADRDAFNARCLALRDLGLSISRICKELGVSNYPVRAALYGISGTSKAARRNRDGARTPNPVYVPGHHAGAKHANALLSESDVRDIRAAASSGASVSGLAKQYGVDRRTIRGVINRTRYASVK